MKQVQNCFEFEWNLKLCTFENVASLLAVVYVSLGKAVAEYRWGGSRNIPFMRHKFPELTVKRGLNRYTFTEVIAKLKLGYHFLDHSVQRGDMSPLQWITFSPVTKIVSILTVLCTKRTWWWQWWWCYGWQFLSRNGWNLTHWHHTWNFASRAMCIQPINQSSQICVYNIAQYVEWLQRRYTDPEHAETQHPKSSQFTLYTCRDNCLHSAARPI